MAHPLDPRSATALAPRAADDSQHPQVIHRMTTEVYAHYERKLRATSLVEHDTTVLQAGYMLGIERALRVLREGYVVETR